jgi:hypothetical protein
MDPQERFHRGMADALIAVHKRMVAHQRETQRRRLVRQVRIQFLAAEGHLRLGQRRIQSAEIPYAS